MFGPADCCIFFSGCPFENCLIGTELLQSPFRTEFSIWSPSRRYWLSLQRHLRFRRSYRRSLRHCRDPCVIVVIPEAISGRAIANVAMPIVDWLTKHRKTLWNIMKHLNTPVWNFLLRIKHTFSTYFCGERLISHCMANIWIRPLCQEFQRCFKRIIMNAI